MEKRYPHWHLGAPTCQDLTLGVTQKSIKLLRLTKELGQREVWENMHYVYGSVQERESKFCQRT